MMEHITQEVAVELSIKAGDEFAIHEAEFYTNLCNAAIQQWIDSKTAELPVMPEPCAHMYPDDLERFQETETFAHAYSVKVGSPDGVSVELVLLSDAQAYGLRCRLNALEEVAEWIRPQRNDVPCTGEEFANAIKEVK